MATREVSATDAARKLGDLLARVRYRGESFLIRRGKRIVAALGPPPAAGPTGAELRAWWRDHPRLEGDDAERFDRDVKKARRRLNVPPKSPWSR